MVNELDVSGCRTDDIMKYSDAVAVHGPDSPEAKQLRSAHRNDAEFLAYADAIDGIRNSIKKRATKSPNIDSAH